MVAHGEPDWWVSTAPFARARAFRIFSGRGRTAGRRRRLQAARYSLDAGFQSVRRKRLGDVIIHAEFLAALDDLGVGRAGDQDEARILDFRVCPDFLQQGQAVHVRHVVVGNDEMAGRLVKGVQRIGAVLFPAKPDDANFFERLINQSTTCCCVVDNENLEFFL